MIPTFFKKAIRRLLPEHYFKALQNMNILEVKYGHLKTAKLWSCVDRTGNPIPWYTYPAIEYIKQLDFSDKSIFEYGSGNSSLFWGQRANRVISVENDSQWFQSIAREISTNNEIHYLEQEEYIKFIHNYPDKFDVVIIDGRWRKECAREAIQKLNQNGLVILDNSDWHVSAAEVLRDANLIEVDMTGFGPINGYTWTTSFFFTREFNFEKANQFQPNHGIGSIQQYADD